MAVQLWHPHLHLDVDRLAQRSTLTGTHTCSHVCLCVHRGMRYTHFTHADANAYRTHAHKNTHVRTLLQTLAAGMAMCTNTPTVTHPLNLHRQKPRATTSLSAVKPGHYDKPLSVFSLPFLTVHYRHQTPPLTSALQFRMITLLSHMIDNLEITGPRRHTFAKHVMCRISLRLPSPKLYRESQSGSV